MAIIKVKCPYCGSEDVIEFGRSRSGKKRYECKNSDCEHRTFQSDYAYKARTPGMHDTIVNMAMNGSGTRDTARVLGIDKDTVTRHLRKLHDSVQFVNTSYLDRMKNQTIDVIITNPLEDQSGNDDGEDPGMTWVGGVGPGAEMDGQWSWIHDKHHQCRLWWAVDHATNTPFAFTFGTGEYGNLDTLLGLLKPFNINTYYTDNNFAYSSRIDADHLKIGKRNTQQIERDHLTLRTRVKRLARKTICFSKKEDMHVAVVGTFINRFFFDRAA